MNKNAKKLFSVYIINFKKNNVWWGFYDVSSQLTVDKIDFFHWLWHKKLTSAILHFFYGKSPHNEHHLKLWDINAQSPQLWFEFFKNSKILVKWAYYVHCHAGKIVFFCKYTGQIMAIIKTGILYFRGVIFFPNPNSAKLKQ